MFIILTIATKMDFYNDTEFKEIKAKFNAVYEEFTKSHKRDKKRYKGWFLLQKELFHNSALRTTYIDANPNAKKYHTDEHWRVFQEQNEIEFLEYDDRLF